MSPDAYRKRLASLDLTQEQAGELFGASARTGQRWAAEAAILILAGSAAFVRVRLIESGWMWTVSNW